MVNRERLSRRPRVPALFSGLGPMLHNFSPKIFLGDVTASDGSTAVLFSTPDMLRRMSEAREIHSDGTFEVSKYRYIYI